MLYSAQFQSVDFASNVRSNEKEYINLQILNAQRLQNSDLVNPKF